MNSVTTVRSQAWGHAAVSTRMPDRATTVCRAHTRQAKQCANVSRSAASGTGLDRTALLAGAAVLLLAQPAGALVDDLYEQSRDAKLELERLVEERGGQAGTSLLDLTKGSLAAPEVVVIPETQPTELRADPSIESRKTEVLEMPRVPEPLPAEPAEGPLAEADGSSGDGRPTVQITSGGDLPALPPQLREAQETGADKATPPEPVPIPGVKVESLQPQPSLPASSLLSPSAQEPSGPASTLLNPNAEGPSAPAVAKKAAEAAASSPNILPVSVAGVVALAVTVFSLMGNSASEAQAVVEKDGSVTTDGMVKPEEKELVKAQNRASGDGGSD